MNTIGVAVASLTVGLSLQPLNIRWLRRRGLLDRPNDRSSHSTPTPRGGGVAVLIALASGVLLGPSGHSGLLVLCGALTLGVVGLIDDLRGLKAELRLILLVGAGAIFGTLIKSPLPIALAMPALAIWIATYVNAFNFMDGINGLSALSGAVAGASFLAMGFSVDSAPLAVIGAALTGASMSFVPFNLANARVFLGDVGSYSLGFTVAAAAWIAWSAGIPAIVAVSPAAIYLLDTGSTLAHRIRARQPIMKPHRLHIYQRLASLWGSHIHASFVVSTTTAALVVVAWLGTATDSAITRNSAAVLACIILAGYLSLVRVTLMTKTWLAERNTDRGTKGVADPPPSDSRGKSAANDPIRNSGSASVAGPDPTTARGK